LALSAGFVVNLHCNASGLRTIPCSAPNREFPTREQGIFRQNREFPTVIDFMVLLVRADSIALFSRVAAGLVPATPIIPALCLKVRGRRDKPGDDAGM
jgi:hypothetical protein